ncbi:GNAT family N-acetyltransferase [Variovorax robiniae]|uniref:GNAT family N-acetyltransferase n=1 Tax=Variovorax robiniae TaxID=1836199 RepID=A0ABU8XI30_9BURK
MMLRPSWLGDVRAMISVRQSALCSIGMYSPAQMKCWRQAVDETELRTFIDQEDGTSICAVEEGQSIVGYACLRFGTSAHLLGLYAAAAWQRRGVGTALLLAAHAICADRNVSRVHVAASMNAAPFYAGHGYVEGNLIQWRPQGTEEGPEIPTLRMTYSFR